MMKSIRHFKPILLGLLVFILINGLLTMTMYWLPGLDERFNGKVGNVLPRKLSQLDKQGSVEVLALGTSQTHNGFSTKSFDETAGLSSFNMGMPGTRYDVMQTYLQYHIAHYGKPKVVLLEVTDALAEEETLYFYLPALNYHTLFKRDPDLIGTVLRNPTVDLAVHREMVFSTASVFYQFRPLFAPMSILKKVSKVSKAVLNVPVRFVSGMANTEAQANSASLPARETVTFDERWTAKGRAPRPAHPGMATPAGIEKDALDNKAYYLDAMDGVDFTKLRAFLDFCQKEGIEVVLVEWPNHPAYRKAFYQSRIYQPYWSGLNQVRAEYDVELVDLNQEKSLIRNELFADTRHLTPEGAQIFSSLLGQRVQTVKRSI